MSTTLSCPIRGSVPRRFAALSKPAQRVAIARDVIKQIKTKRLKAETGVFVKLDDIEGHAVDLTKSEKPNITVKELLAKHKVKTCEVCALGGLMMAQFAVNGDFPLAQLGHNTDSWDGVKITPYTPEAWKGSNAAASPFSPYVLTYFIADQLTLIEIAFEGGDGAFDCEEEVNEWRDCANAKYFEKWATDEKVSLTVEQASAAIRFGARFGSNRTRLIGIMNAIIKGKGTFDPVALTTRKGKR